jgi:hypothetical protein
VSGISLAATWMRRFVARVNNRSELRCDSLIGKRGLARNVGPAQHRQTTRETSERVRLLARVENSNDAAFEVQYRRCEHAMHALGDAGRRALGYGFKSAEPSEQLLHSFPYTPGLLIA